MNPWPFVIAAYAVAIVATGGLLLSSYLGMRHAEIATAAFKRR